VILHAIFIFSCFNFISPIKIYKEEVIDVVIVPPEKIFIPNIDKYPAVQDDFNINSLERRLKKKYGVPEEKIEFESEEFGEYIEYKADDIAFNPDLSSGFRLDLPSRSEPDQPLDNKLTLSLSSEKKDSIINDIGKGYEKKDLNIWKYVYFNYSNIRPLKSYPSSGGYRTGTPLYKGSASFYDITPWAERVVDRIQKNWIIPSKQKTSVRGVVRISVIIKKNGELFSVKIVNSSMVQSLDEAALKAIKMSSPFPNLPDDFPKMNLEAYFEFQYND